MIVRYEGLSVQNNANQKMVPIGIFFKENFLSESREMNPESFAANTMFIIIIILVIFFQIYNI